jgi:hypothetical protein
MRKVKGKRKAISGLQLTEPRQFEGQSPEGKIIGSLIAIVQNTVEGWALNVQDPAKPVTVDIFDGDRLLGSAAAFMFRPELSAAGIGNGNHYFQFALPEDVFDGNVHTISARPTGTAAISSIDKSREPAVGMLETVSDDGWVKGWAWYPDVPDRRVEIEILADGEVVGDTLAATHRSDLLAAGKGDGNCSFSYGLPAEVLRRPKGTLISIREKQTGQTISEPRLFQRREIEDALAKLADLENDTRLLDSTVALAARGVAADSRAAAELFRTVGDFFLQLAAATAAGKPPSSLQTLGAAIEHVTSRFPPIELGISSEPESSICVEASGTLDDIYNTLRSISGAQSNIAREVVLFHSGACDDAPLLPLVARDLRYFHAEGGLSLAALKNRVAELSRGEIIIFLAGFAEPTGAWLDAVISTFNADRSVAMVGAKIIRPDGVLENAGISLLDQGPEVIGRGADPTSAAFTHSRRIDAVAGEAFAVRRSAWQRNGGLSESLSSMESSLIDFCVRTAVAGGIILYEPQFVVVLRR